MASLDRAAPDTELVLYFDGSCLDNQNVTADTPAGWGFVVVVGDGGLGRGDGSVIAEGSGRVVTDREASDWLGAEVGSNNTAELSAVAHALRWLLTDGGTGATILRGDSQYALNIAAGNWKAKANKQLAARVQSLWDEVAAARPLENEHVRAHRGQRWNERSDHLAYRAMQVRHLNHSTSGNRVPGEWSALFHGGRQRSGDQPCVDGEQQQQDAYQ